MCMGRRSNTRECKNLIDYSENRSIISKTAPPCTIVANSRQIIFLPPAHTHTLFGSFYRVSGRLFWHAEGITPKSCKIKISLVVNVGKTFNAQEKQCGLEHQGLECALLCECVHLALSLL